jgi:hypothetical protein
VVVGLATGVAAKENDLLWVEAIGYAILRLLYLWLQIYPSKSKI